MSDKEPVNSIMLYSAIKETKQGLKELRRTTGNISTLSADELEKVRTEVYEAIRETLSFRDQFREIQKRIRDEKKKLGTFDPIHVPLKGLEIMCKGMLKLIESTLTELGGMYALLSKK